jgi:hypothetical protein
MSSLPLPAGVTAVLVNQVSISSTSIEITLEGTPEQEGVFNYQIVIPAKTPGPQDVDVSVVKDQPEFTDKDPVPVYELTVVFAENAKDKNKVTILSGLDTWNFDAVQVTKYDHGVFTFTGPFTQSFMVVDLTKVWVGVDVKTTALGLSGDTAVFDSGTLTITLNDNGRDNMAPFLTGGVKIGIWFDPGFADNGAGKLNISSGEKFASVSNTTP